ncbi:MAG: hypothetical protein KatS3mg101_1173 [Patescibacteria group bacterium]|nr:MAG: hypothetical protein KatS3mg101_1173 [Patescibacteria group bacterium]
MKEVTTYLPEDVKEKLKLKAREAGVSLSTYIRIILLKSLRDPEGAPKTSK